MPKLLTISSKQKMKKCDTLELLSVRITKFQAEYLKIHKELTGNSPGEVIRALLDLYIAMGEEDDKKEH